MTSAKLETCPHCGSDLRGKQIPPEDVAKGYYGPPTDEPRYFFRTIGVEIRGVYDGVLFWRCPDCGGSWHRWDLPDMMAQAEKYMHKSFEEIDQEA